MLLTFVGIISVAPVVAGDLSGMYLDTYTIKGHKSGTEKFGTVVQLQQTAPGKATIQVDMCHGSAYAATCCGDVEATGTIQGNKVIATATDSEYPCKLVIKVNQRNQLSIDEVGGCMAFHGISCSFGMAKNLRRVGPAKLNSERPW